MPAMQATDPSGASGGRRAPAPVAGLALAIGLVAACRATSPPPAPPGPLAAPPGLTLAAGHYAGTALGGPLPDRTAADLVLAPEGLLGLDLAALYLRLPPEELRPLAPGELTPLAGAFELALDLDLDPGVLATPRLFEGGLVARGPEAERVFEDLAALAEPLGLTLARHREVLGPGLAFELIGRADQRVEDNDNFLGEFPRRPAIPMGFRLALDATAGNDPARPRLAWCLGLEGALPEDPEATRPPGRERYRPGSPAPASELLRPGPAPAPGEPVLVLVRAPFVAGEGATLALYVAATASAADPGAEAALGPALDRALAAVDLRSALLAADLAAAGTGDFLARTVPEALGRLERLRAAGADPRTTLLFLAGALDAPLAMDVLLAVDAAELASLTDWLLEDERTGARGPRWSLEHHAWRALQAGTAGGRLGPPTAGDDAGVAPELPDRSAGQLAALQGLVLRHAGEVGRFPRLLEALLVASVDEQDLHERLVAENRAFLEDSSPAARVRAYDWLAARDRAPALYDPLARRGARRTALEADRAGRRAAAAASGGAPVPDATPEVTPGTTTEGAP